MSAYVFGLPSDALTPGKDFRAVKDSTGKWTASMSFDIRRGDFSDVEPLLAKGELVSTIYPNVDAYFANMVIDNYEFSENQGGSGGGIDRITVNFVGFEEGDEGQSERETVYDHTTSLGERPIIEHPLFISEVESGVGADSYGTRDMIVACYHGLARWEAQGSGAVDVKLNGDSLPVGTITDPVALEWFDIIIRQGKRTFDSPESEYVETKTDLGGLSDASVEKMGKKDTPPNNPATPPDKFWRLTGASETRSSENPITWTRTWSTIDDNDLNTKLYDY